MFRTRNTIFVKIFDVRIKLLVFGIFTDIFKANALSIEIEKPLNVGQFKEHIMDKYPQTASLNFAVAVDEAYAEDDVVIQENQVVALIPPVSGG